MKTIQKFLAPIFGLRKSLKRDIRLDKYLLFRNTNFLDVENELFKKYELHGDYKAVLEIDYEYNSDDSNEPLPGVFLKIINKFDSSLVVFGNGKVGVAAVIPSPKTEDYPGGGILFTGKVLYEETLDKEIDENFNVYYKKFSKAYDLRPVAFDVFRRSQERFTNNDKAIDNCIVLESIFVPLEEKSKKPFILNGMKIMGFDTNEVNSINNLIEYRNAIIHADKKKQLKLLSGPKYTYKWFEEAFVLIRKILYKYVENPWA